MSVTRHVVMDRAAHGWPIQGVDYSQSTFYGAYRADCSGYVSMALGLDPGGPGCWGGANTVTLVTNGYVTEINPNDLKPGDLIGHLGEGTAGDNGHVQIFAAWDNGNPNDNGHVVYEQTPDRGPYLRHYANWTTGYKAYRYTGIIDDAPTPPPAPRLPYPLTLPDVFGPFSDPRATVHGGYYAWEKPYVLRIQQRLQQLGFAPATPGWADTRWDDPTTRAVMAFQRAHGGLAVDGLVGPATWGALFS